MILPRGNIYVVKRIGPNTDPWGTPQVNGMLFEFTPLIRTDCFLSERYDLNHWRATSQTPRWDCSLDKRMLWSMVSNAALKSRSNRMTHCFSSICLNISPCTEVNAVSVLWNFLYEGWNSSHRLLIYMWSCSLSATTRSINLDKKVRFETGLIFLNNSGSGLRLRKSITVKRYLLPLFSRAKDLRSTRSAPHFQSSLLVSSFFFQTLFSLDDGGCKIYFLVRNVSRL